MTYVYWLTDIFEQVQMCVPNLKEICDQFYDYVITYDPCDAEKYGFNYVETPYGVDKGNGYSEPQHDLLYIGNAKIETDLSRYKKIISI